MNRLAAMDNIKGTTARLRRTFRYPADDDDDGDGGSETGSPEALDEEEQETLIQTLAEENAARNAQFRLVLLALPLLAAAPYLLTLLSGLVASFRRSSPSPSPPSSSPSSASSTSLLVSLLGLTSLLSTAYLVHALPPARTGIPALDRWLSSSSSSPPSSSSGRIRSEYDEEDDDDEEEEGEPSAYAQRLHHRRRRGRASSFSLPHSSGGGYFGGESPLRRHLPLLNAGLCAVLVLTGLLTTPNNDGNSNSSGSGSELFGRAAQGCLPAVVYGVVLAAKATMAGVDPERELGGLRYEYKGA